MTNDDPQPLVSIATAALSPAPDGWGAPILLRQEGDLQNALRSFRGDRPGPFAGVRLTGAEVYWLAAYLLATNLDTTVPSDTLHQRMQSAYLRLNAATEQPLLRISLDFSKLNLSGAQLGGAHLEGAVLGKAQLTGAVLGVAQLNGAYLGGAVLRDVFLDRADLTRTTLADAQLQGASMRNVILRKAECSGAWFDDAILRYGNLKEARFIRAHLHNVDLRAAELQQANFIEADLAGAFLYEAHLEGTLFTKATLIGCDLRRTTFDPNSRLNDAKLNHAWLEQAFLQDTNLAVAEWKDVATLSDEREAREAHKRTYHYESVKHIVQQAADKQIDYVSATRIRGYREHQKTRQQRVDDYRAAERAYRALSARLNEQGVAREAARFQYRAELMARNANFHRGVAYWPTAFASFLLGWLSGYGIYNIWRLLLTYIGVILAFTIFYLGYGAQNGQPVSWMAFLNALLLSVTTLHGRGFAQLATHTNLLFSVVATTESVLGVGVEALVVAALVRRITGD